MKQTTRRLLNIFLAGLLTALPLVATVIVIVLAVQFVYRWLGPTSPFGAFMRRLGFGLGETEFAAYLVGLGIVAVLIFLLGLVVQTGLARFWQRAVGGLMQRIPVVGSIYDLIKTFVDLLGKRDQDKLKSMQPVWVRFGGGAEAVRVLALLSTREPLLVAGVPHHAVIVPTAPVPVGGGLLYVPVDWIEPAEVGLDQLTSIYVSMGVTSGQYFPVGATVADSTRTG
ncbi:MAG: DUF502 domain-containing protein [Casimicrobiaceae bacterium]|nr:DUF502 domain-containing protein [Casimicrobiaceae bacterium]